MSADRLANLLGASAIVVGDALRHAADGALCDRPAIRGLGVPAALVTLSNYPGEPVDALRAALGLSHSATVRLVDRLTAEGLVTRRTSPADRRVVLVDLTPAGRALAARVLSARQTALTTLLEPLDADSRGDLSAALELLLGSATHDRPASRRICRLCDERSCVQGPGCPVDQAVAK